MCRFVIDLCAVVSKCDVRDLVCVMCGMGFMLRAAFSLCDVQFAATNLVASLRTCVASIRREGPNIGPTGGPKGFAQQPPIMLWRGGDTGGINRSPPLSDRSVFPAPCLAKS